MDKLTAQRLVRNTLKAPFDRKRYHGLVNELCNGFDDAKARNMTVPDAFAAHVKSCQRLGTFTSLEEELADVLVVHLTESWKLERSRTALRDFVAHKLKRGEGSDSAYKEAGLIAFVAPVSQSWRFSYVRMDYATKRDPQTGKIKTEERLTPARRYSYLVGAEEECHTAQTRFLALLQNTAAKPTLAQIEEAFSVESVTKEFFNEYARLFKAMDEALTAVVARHPAIHADFAVKGISTVDFAKKLLGQIVFLYFIQKKGWLGVSEGQSWGEGPRHFLRQLADQAVAQGQCLFNEVLEPLFYDTLATDRGAEAWCPHFKCRIPFLNGGLFEPLAGYDWEQRAIALPNALFTNRQLTPSGDIGTGILDIFDRYNFTVNEAEPLEKEVAIDPEMLGKVFENLIEENRRKGLGAFYTPREIVHYMCQESLINYLDTTLNQSGKKIERADVEALIREGEQAAHYETARKDGTVSYQRRLPKAIEEQARALDEALRTILVCDPAIGSGAFPVGMMTEIVRARMALTPYFDDTTERTAYHFKRHAIQNSLYGVDIDIGAVEIAKLRLWLSLVVDEEDVQQIKPLPNLDYKVVVGNSLLGFPFKSQKLSEIEKLKGQFFEETNHNKKVQLKSDVDKLLMECLAGSKKSLGYEVNFDFEIHFSEVFHTKGGFDVVVGNPPYISAVVHAQMESEIRDLYRTKYPLLKGAFDIYTVFLLQGTKIINLYGSYSWIVPNKFLVSDYSRLALDHLKKNGLYSMVDVSNYDVFKNTGVYPIILIGSKLSDLFTEYQITGLADLQYNKLIKKQKVRIFETFKQHNIKISSGTTGFQANTLIPYLYENYVENSMPFVVSGCIDRYCVDFSNVRYMGHKYKNAFIKKPNSLADSKWCFWMNEKIIIAGMTKVIEAFYYTKPLALGVGVYAIHDYGGFNPKFLLALLNSKYLSYYLNLKFRDKHLAGGYLAINKSTIEELPLLSIPQERQKQFADYVDNILVAKNLNSKTDTTSYERNIDQLVYQLYGLTPDEISLIENSC